MRTGPGGIEPVELPDPLFSRNAGAEGGRAMNDVVTPPEIAFELDGAQVTARLGETLWEVARRVGTTIPHLCHRPEPGYRPDGNCRVCMVEIEGERVLAASCKRTPSVGMKVHSQTERATKARAMVMELLVADQPARETSHNPDSAFWSWAERSGVTESRFPAAQ